MIIIYYYSFVYEKYTSKKYREMQRSEDLNFHKS